MSSRFYCSTPITSQAVTLSGSEAHHLLHVMRLAEGAEVVLFDGSGTEFPARVQNVARDKVELLVIDRRAVDRELPLELTLAVALPKGDRQRWLVEKAVELGASRLVPLETHHGVAVPTPSVLKRLRRAVVETSKQCGRNHLAEVCDPQPWTSFILSAPPDALRLVAHPDHGRSLHEVLTSGSVPHHVMLAIGPEGGLTDDEVSVALNRSWIVVDLGPRILRVETASLAMAAVVSLMTATQ
jgi:16S rRNA (uracil1498-N3)-methyltransferase